MLPPLAPISVTPPDNYGGGALSDCLNGFYNLIAKICSAVFDFFKCILCCRPPSSETPLDPESVSIILPTTTFPTPSPLPVPPSVFPPPEPNPEPSPPSIGGGNFLPSAIDWEEEYKNQDYSKSGMEFGELVELYYNSQGKDKDYVAAAVQKKDPDLAKILKIAPSASYLPHTSYQPQTTSHPRTSIASPPVKATLPERVTVAAQKAIEQVANTHVEYLNRPIDPALKRSSYYKHSSGGYELFKQRPLVEMLAKPYVSGGFYQAINRYMRFGALETGYVKCFENEEDLKTYYAHFQKSIQQCSDRVNTPGNLVHRVSYCAKSLAAYCVEQIKQGIMVFLTNKSILSTSSEYINWNPSTCAGVAGAAERSGQVVLHMQIQLLPNTPLLNANAHGVGLSHEKEMILPAGRALRVKSCTERPKPPYSYSDIANYDLVLEEVEPESLADPLPDNAELCLNML